MKTTTLAPFARLTAAVMTVSFSCLLNACELPPNAKAASVPVAAVANTDKAVAAAVTDGGKEPVKPADATTVLSRKEVPILCYHHIRDWKPTDSKTSKDYIVPVANFRSQMKMLADSGYHTITPDQLYAYLNTGAALPSKPVLITFDDTDLDQYTVANPELKKYGFKATYFIMTVSLGRPNYMSKEQVKELSDAGNTIGSHTWDHHNVKQYQGQDWVTQIEKPTKQLEAITGKPIHYFAYPFGLWNPQAIPQLKQRGMIAAFQLYAKRDQQDPLYTIRRIIVPGSWNGANLYNSMQRNFGG
ncbi:MAG: polysaccharide deacetylase family protein [Chitinophagaceae bacterium]